jgi:hypothetical protein
MAKMEWRLKVVVVGVFFLLSSAAAHAQATRTWVSGVGDDANPCSRTAPCKTFAGAISKTAAGGEISTLDPGSFGAVTITKSITISGDGTLSGILAAGTNGVIVNAGANDTVILRNLSIHGAGTGLNGIRYLAGRALHVENSTISGFSNRGIDVVFTGATAGALSVADTNLTNIGSVGIRVDTAAGSLSPSVLLDNVEITKALIGFDVLRASVATISNSSISDVTNQAIVAENNAVINAEGCVLTRNGTGIAAFSAGSTIRISDCSIFNNTVGVSVAGGAFGDRFGNNAVFGNGTDFVGVVTLTPLQ